ncbi:MAG: anhydro-N-acetylmuramic acid kinase [Pseudomonadota bacterium]
MQRAQEEDGPIWALGLMSGTSFDGIDAALLLTDGETVEAFGPASARAYRAEELPFARAVHADWTRFRWIVDGRAAPVGAASEGLRVELAEAHGEVDEVHAAATASLILRAAQDPAVIGYHGQTVAHDPEAGWTWQLGDGEGLARALRRPVVWDFRGADMAAGGQGAPLAPLYHFALARRLREAAPMAVLNIGGVANVTWIDPRAEGPEAPGALVAFDTGPGNALIDDFVRRRGAGDYDRNGEIAAAGRPDPTTVQRNALIDYARRAGPKSLDRNAFQAVLEAVRDMRLEDGAATLTAVTVEMIAEAAAHFPEPAARWIVCGGGRRNLTLVRGLSERLGAPVLAAEAAGLDGDMIEAQAFAYLAVRALRCLPLSVPGTTGCAAPTRGGRISRP